MYNCNTIPPLLQTHGDVRKEFTEKTFLKAIINGCIVGSLRVWLDGKTVQVEKLAVRPQMQNQGIATCLLKDIEKRFPCADRYELFTGRLSYKNLYLYRKLGYHEYKTRQIGAIELVYLEKHSQNL